MMHNACRGGALNIQRFDCEKRLISQRRLPSEVFRARPTGRRPRGRPRTRWRDDLSQLAWERLGILQNELGNVAGEGSLGQPAGSAAPATRPRTKRMGMDGWM